MLDSTFHALAELARRRTGQALSPSKAYLVDARLSGLVRREGFATLDDMMACLEVRPNPVLEAEIAAALLSRNTWFFRERDCLERIVQDVLPGRLKASKSGRLKVWCAGGSTGQEAYSLAIRLAEMAGEPGLRGSRVEIVSTDLCRRTTEQARLGTFGHYEVQRGLSIHRLLAHFQRLESGSWKISEALREAVSFRQHNLLDDPSGLGQFDVILCRNVITGMAPDVRTQVAEALSAQLAADGVLMLGHGETLTGVTKLLQPSRHIRAGWQRPSGATQPAAA